MSKNYSLNPDGSFLIRDYNRVYPFSNFLPGISGPWGIPLWVFYVNRAQGIASFGIKDKDHSISEFFPADKAYSYVSQTGFRTFIKSGKNFHEPFKASSAESKNQQLLVKSDCLEIGEVNQKIGLKVTVRYFTLPNTPVPGLVRVFSLKNISGRKLNLEIADGLSRIIPFGSTQWFLKEMSRTLQAWMQAELHRNLAVFRLIVDPRDTSHTKYIEGANFNCSFYEEAGRKVHPQLVVDPENIFGQETSYNLPLNFIDSGFKAANQELTRGKTPCAFSCFNWKLSAGQEKTLYSLFGASESLEAVKKFIPFLSASFLKEKEKENRRIVEEIKSKAFCASGLKNFDHYLQNSYLDNVLRGGYPYSENKAKAVGSQNSYYIYSRKHGDLERDYNNFQVSPTQFSEGEGNYRDINQNRRLDLFFQPGLEDKNIIYFLNFIKLDGYNPLLVKGEKLSLNEIAAKKLLKKFSLKDSKLLHLLIKGFYLGELFTLLVDEKIKLLSPRDLISDLLSSAKAKPQGLHTEGYWIDHWRYNLDLIESFLYFYPDKLTELFLKKEFTFWDDEHRILPRSRRYILRSGKPYQGESLEAVKEKKQAIKGRKDDKNILRAKNGKIYKTSLAVKLLSLILNKATTLDPYGVGIEMEADKPGWCDSLNGLPALFGSSVCETFELKRAVLLLGQALRKLRISGLKKLTLPQELANFLKQTNGLLSLNPKISDYDYKFWDRSNCLKEDFRQKTFFCLSGRESSLSLGVLEGFLNRLLKKLDRGLAKAKDKKSGLPRTYFTYQVTKFKLKNKHHFQALSFKQKALPLFLEGVVHALRIGFSKNIYQKTKQSKLFDRNLKMYRLNESLAAEPLEIGRSRAFAPGWLENESIWLHMEYKYLLELLKNGFYQEFFADFKNCGVCFFDPEKYGRSIVENSSFIVSSAYPDKRLWGRGYVARLSGATAEVLNIWALLCLGREPFFINQQGKLCLQFNPILRGEFFTDKPEVVVFKGKPLALARGSFCFQLFSQTLVCYHNPKRRDTFKPGCEVERIVAYSGSEKMVISSNTIPFPLSEAVRKGRFERIEVYFKD
ncbi:MAG: cellobiose phosphorylase [Candidatus Omnitrophica bacterium]|nr:cellobiose phosphorylase [Candidatus Omnitrophota bacterium]